MYKNKYEFFENIASAIKQFEPCHPINMTFQNGTMVRRNNSNFQLFEYGEKMIVLPNHGLSSRFYRGEHEEFPNCKSSINRLTGFEKIIAEIKKIEFIDIIKTFPAITYAESDGHLVDYEALAQHYEMKSNVIDLTSDLIVAAFFATNKYDIDLKTYIPIDDGVGVIWFYDATTYSYNKDNKFRYTGLQPFKRTEEQCAFSFYLSENEDFNQFAYKVYFKQNKIYGKLIKSLFEEHNELVLFPKERVAEVAELMNNLNSIHRGSIEKYNQMNDTKFSYSDFQKFGIRIRNDFIFRLSSKEIDEMRIEVENNRFGDKFVTARLAYRP